MKNKVFKIFPDGKILTVHDDSLPDMGLGDMSIERASHVLFDEVSQTWDVVIDNVVVLDGFIKRGDAIEAEVKYLNNQLAGDS